MAVIDSGSNSAGKANVDAYYNLSTALTNIPAAMGGVRLFSENDPGLALGGVPELLSPETDDDYRIRTSNDMILDEESFIYTAQNFTKTPMYATTFAPSWTNTGFNTNPTAITTINAAMCLKTYKTFSIYGTETLSLDIEGSFSAAVVTNNTIEFGWGLTANTTPYDCFDGAYIRVNNVGVYAVVRNNSTTDTVQSAAFNDYTGALFVPVVGRKYQFIVYLTSRETDFWVADPVSGQIWLAGSISAPPGYGMPVGSQAVNVFVRQAHAASAPATAAGFNVARWSVRRGGTNIGTTLNVLNARANESSLSPGTLGTTFANAITTGSITRAAAAVPTNTTALLMSLGGIVMETCTVAQGTDFILMAYGCPALPVATGTTYALNKRLRIDGLSITTTILTALTAGGFSRQFYLAYGSTSVSLAGVAADTVTTKADRRVMLPFYQFFAATAAVGTQVPSSLTYFALQTPIFINPGEFVKLVAFNTGTAATAGATQNLIQFDYSWE